MKAEIISEHRADILAKGASAAGYKVVHFNRQPEPDDILICWNYKKINRQKISIYENIGANVIVAENGYIGEGEDGSKLTALAIGGHMGAGKWYIGTDERYKRQNIKIRKWREGGEEIVVLAQRGIGQSKDYEWAVRMQGCLQRQTKRPVRVRQHPGKRLNQLEFDLNNAWAVLTWSSAAAIKAIAYGVPAFYMMPGWIGKDAAKLGMEEIENPYLGNREKMFHAVGWAQWQASEIESGEAIKTLIDNTKLRA